MKAIQSSNADGAKKQIGSFIGKYVGYVQKASGKIWTASFLNLSWFDDIISQSESTTDLKCFLGNSNAKQHQIPWRL